jgi:glycosyltransferase involved in cell wall biosynthesis
MRDIEPTVSIGLPVYNGDRYLAETIQSILAQTYSDLELIICDNASTDATREICEQFAARDRRVRYHRNPENLGAARNFNRTVELARGKYFKWNGHDDPMPPTLLERCVAALECDPTVVLAYGTPCPIDEHGCPTRPGPLVAARLRPRPGLASHNPRARYFACVAVPAGHPVGVYFGLIRSDALRRALPLGSYVSHDLPFLAEMTLRGRFEHVPEVVQYRRYHPGQGHRTHRTRAERESWFDPARATLRTFPRLRLLREHVGAIRRATTDPRLRFWCYGGTLVWFAMEVGFIRPAKATMRGLYRRLKPG